MFVRHIGRCLLTAISYTVFLLATFSFAKADDACIALVKQGIYNTNSTLSSQQNFAQYKNSFCSWFSNYRTIHATGSAGLQIPIADIPLGIDANMTHGQAEAQYQALCTANSGASADSQVYQTVSQYISPQSLASYVDCIKAEKSGISSNVSISDDNTLFTIDMAYIAPLGASPTATVLQVSLLPDGAFQCPKPGNGGTDIRDLVAKSGKFINQDSALSCSRVINTPAIMVNGTEVAAPSAMVSIQTTVGTYTQLFRPIVKAEPLADTAKVLAALPKGTILPWAGSVASIPQGWHLCDGKAGTPNLVKRYPLGTDSDQQIGSQTGSDTIRLHLSGDTGGIANGDVQSIDNSSNYLKAAGTGHDHHYDTWTDVTPWTPSSTYIIYIIKIS